jgi:choline kinase
MAKLPKDFKESTWKDIKSATLTDTGVSGALRPYVELRKKLNAPATRCYQAFQDVQAAITLIETKTKAAIDKANKTIHANDIKALKEYGTLCKTERNDVKQLLTTYDTNVKGWIKLKTDSANTVITLYKDFQTYVDTTVQKTLDDAKVAISGKDKVAAKTLLQDAIAQWNELATKQEEFDKEVEVYRVPISAEKQAHVDDRPKEVVALFKKVTDASEGFNGLRGSSQSSLSALQKELAKVK